MIIINIILYPLLIIESIIYLIINNNNILKLNPNDISYFNLFYNNKSFYITSTIK